jgi:hypothetical protein
VSTRYSLSGMTIASVVLGLLLWGSAALAEPYLAVEAGLKCMTCHVNPSGGGKRTPFGMLYARNQIASRVVGAEDTTMPWTGDIARWFAVGGDYRGGYESVDVPRLLDQSDVDTSRATLYAEVRAIPQLLTVYADYRFAPDNSETREAYVLVTPQRGKYTIKAGQFFLPFGLRLEDDNSFVRESSGINFNNPDEGVELGLELARWSAQLAVTEGAGSGSDGQMSLSATYNQPRWRVGASYNSADDVLGDRRMQTVFGGWRTGPIAWLAELDFITDDSPGRDRDRYASLVEGNWRFRKGHNLKVGYEYLDPDMDRSEDQQERYSIVWEYSPIQFLQTRLGARLYNGIPNFPTSNRDEVFAQLHVYF